jgi:predicted ATP-grasp superfamily ATP-dependent carboligase
MIFVFEYTSCVNDFNGLIAEGFLMFKTLVRSKLKPKAFIRPGLPLNLPRTRDWRTDFLDYLSGCDYALIVAPENDWILYELTKTVEKYSQNLGSDSKAIRITSDKWELYKKLKGKVDMPKTSLKPLDCDYIVKPRVSCDGEGIVFGGEVLDGYIAQEFVVGESVSVSLIVGDEVNVLSCNRQILDGFRFIGFRTPYDLSDEVLECAIKTVESINGLRGYVGVDLIVSDVPYVVDVNARLTTPCIALRDVYGIDLLDVIFKNQMGRLRLDLKPLRSVTFYKALKGVITC